MRLLLAIMAALHMSQPDDENAQIAERISRVENGLVAAIQIQGSQLEKANLLDQMKSKKVPGASITVINNGKIEWSKGYGVLSTASVHTVNAQTRFQAGSISKPVAAFGILTLVSKGDLNLDEDVNRKLTSWKIPENAFTKENKVTLRNLLTHTSGLNVVGFDGYMQREPLPTITQTLDGLKPANNPPVRVEFTPSSKMSYSGGGINVVQQLVEDVAKMPFQEFMQRVVLSPLAMSDSTFDFLDETDLNIAYAHPTEGIPMDGGWKNYPESAAAGLWTTPTDFAKWLIEVQDGITSSHVSHILNHDLLCAMVTPQVGIYGLGPIVNGQGNQLELSHKGRTDGFTCGFVSFPYLKKGAVVMINAGNEAALVDDVLRSIACEYNWPSYSVKIKQTIKLPAETMEKFVGRYGWDEKPNEIYDLHVCRENQNLFWKMGTASNSAQLYPEAENRFFLVDTGYDVVFKESEGSITGLTIIVQPGFEREFRKF